MKTLVNTDHVASKLKRYPAKTARMWKWCGFKSLGEIKLWNQRWWPRNDHKHVKVNGLKSVNIFVVISWLPPLISQLFHSGLVGPQHLLQLACFIVSYSADLYMVTKWQSRVQQNVSGLELSIHFACDKGCKDIEYIRLRYCCTTVIIYHLVIHRVTMLSTTLPCILWKSTEPGTHVSIMIKSKTLFQQKPASH